MFPSARSHHHFSLAPPGQSTKSSFLHFCGDAGNCVLHFRWLPVHFPCLLSIPFLNLLFLRRRLIIHKITFILIQAWRNAHPVGPSNQNPLIASPSCGGAPISPLGRLCLNSPASTLRCCHTASAMASARATFRPTPTAT